MKTSTDASSLLLPSCVLMPEPITHAEIQRTYYYKKQLQWVKAWAKGNGAQGATAAIMKAQPKAAVEQILQEHMHSALQHRNSTSGGDSSLEAVFQCQWLFLFMVVWMLARVLLVLVIADGYSLARSSYLPSSMAACQDALSMTSLLASHLQHKKTWLHFSRTNMHPSSQQKGATSSVSQRDTSQSSWLLTSQKNLQPGCDGVRTTPMIARMRGQ